MDSNFVYRRLTWRVFQDKGKTGLYEQSIVNYFKLGIYLYTLPEVGLYSTYVVSTLSPL